MLKLPFAAADFPNVALSLAEAGNLSGRFTWIDWLVLIGYFVIVTLLGIKLAGKQEDMDDFFLGGKGLPWYAVTGSMIATEISAVTFIGVPYIVFSEGGNFTYLQLGLIAGLIARLFVAFILIPAYYKKRIFSPYDYMGNRLGAGAKGITTALFSLGGLLGQSSRVYLTAVVLEIVMADQLGALAGATGIGTLFWAVLIIGVVSVLWTVIGGISTVIWTDVMLFFVFVSGGIIAVFMVVRALPGGWGELFHVAGEAGKFKTFDMDLSFSPTKEFTIWTAAIGSVFGSIGAYGTDQLMAQRIFVCKNERQAKIAILASWSGQLVTALMLMVGAGLYVFYKTHPEKLTGQALERFTEEPDRIFPIFILTELPVGLTGLIIAGIFAAAVSSMTSILAALSQTTISSVYLPMRAKALGRSGDEEEAHARHDDAEEGRRIVRVSRMLIVAWAVALCLAAFAVDAFKGATDVPILSLALGLASYVWGGLLASFVLAWLPINKNGRGLVWSVPLSVMMVFAVRFHEPWAINACIAFGAVLLVTWLYGVSKKEGQAFRRDLILTPILLVGCYALVLLSQHGAVSSEKIVVTSVQIAQGRGQGNGHGGLEDYERVRDHLAEIGITLDDRVLNKALEGEIEQESINLLVASALNNAGVLIDRELAAAIAENATEETEALVIDGRLQGLGGGLPGQIKRAISRPSLRESDAFHDYIQSTLDEIGVEPDEKLIDAASDAELDESKVFGFVQAHLGEVGITIEMKTVPGNIAWPWYAVIGAFTAFIFGFLLGEEREEDSRS